MPNIDFDTIMKNIEGKFPELNTLTMTENDAHVAEIAQYVAQWVCREFIEEYHNQLALTKNKL